MSVVSGIRTAAVAGTFYPGHAGTLAQDIAAMLDAAAAPSAQDPAPKALIAPHAGYIYSGPVAASAYVRLRPLRDVIKRVVLLGPVHRVAVRGLALPGADAFATPLGKVAIDPAAVAAISHLPQVVVSRPAHAQEHSLEVHLPFLQTVLGDFQIVPLAVGDATGEEVAQVLELLWGGPETLIVVSSDMSHYLGYADARTVDQSTAQAILDLNSHIDHRQACGGTPVNGLMLMARRRGLRPQLLDLRNSGDTAGDRSRVVGYGSFAFYESIAAGAQADDGKVLLPIARAAIASKLGVEVEADASAGWLRDTRACFVTLTQKSELRGCIGSLQPQRALLDDVRENAQAAAFRDPRFKPLSRGEFAYTQVEVSLLSPVSPIGFVDETHALGQLRPLIDGVIFEYGHHRSTFLPQVWEKIADPREFLANLKHKAGLPPDFWDAGVRLSRYTVTKWREPDLVWAPRAY